MLSSVPSLIIFDFHKQANITNWFIVDDVVMGGRSSGSFKLNDDGHGVFAGGVSLENNGGFSSVRYRFESLELHGHTMAVIRLKGDGKKYQFRIKQSYREYYSYIAEFSTSGDWQEIEIPLKDMYPSFRGRRLNMANFDKDSIEEIAFLIGNKKNESFELMLDKIELR